VPWLALREAFAMRRPLDTRQRLCNAAMGPGRRSASYDCSPKEPVGIEYWGAFKVFGGVVNDVGFSEHRFEEGELQWLALYSRLTVTL